MRIPLFFKRLFNFLLVITYLYILSRYFQFQYLNSPPSIYQIFSDKFNGFSITFIIVNIILGFLLGVNQIFSEKQNNGSWKFRYKRFFIMALPVSYFALEVYLNSQFVNIPFFSILFLPLETILRSAFAISYITFSTTFKFFIILGYLFQIVLGYLVSKNIYKTR